MAGYLALYFFVPLLAVAGARHLQLLALDGKEHLRVEAPAIEILNGYGVVGRAAIVDSAERWRLALATADAVGWGFMGPTTDCMFEPHVGLELGPTDHVLFCFTCGLGEGLTLSGISSISTGPAPVFSRALLAHGLPDLRPQ